MTDVIFPCPNCKNNLVVDNQPEVSQIRCPICSKSNIIVPKTSLASSCPSCRQEMLAPEFMHGRTVDCPRCNQVFQIEKKPICIECGSSLDGDAVICVKCGVDQRSGEKVVTQVQSERKLQIRKQQNPFPALDEQVNPILARFQKPAKPESSIFDQIVPIIRSLAMIVVLISGGIYVIQNYQTISRKLESAFKRNTAVTPTNMVVALVAPTNVVGASGALTNIVSVQEEECKLVENLEKTITVLKVSPSDTFALKDLKGYIRTILDEGDGHVVIAGMKSIYALQQLFVGNESVGIKGSDHIQAQYADTEFGEAVNKAKLYIPCSKCQGGQGKQTCDSCEGKGVCRNCKGSGTQQVTRRVVKSLGKTSNGKHTSIGGSGLYETSIVNEPCPMCKTTRKCCDCDGKGWNPSKCQECKGTGLMLSKVNVKTQYDIVVQKTLAFISDMRKRKRILTVSNQQEPDVATLKELLADKKRIGLFDGIIRVCVDKSIQLAIDPDAGDAMVQTRVDIATLASVTNAAGFEPILSRHHLIMKQAPISQDGNAKINFITTESTWAYSQACWYLINGQTDKAWSVLAGNDSDRSTFGRHCQSLHALMKMSNDKRVELKKLAATIQLAVKKQKDEFRNARVAPRSRKLTGWDHVGYHGDYEEAGVSCNSGEMHVINAQQSVSAAKSEWLTFQKTLDTCNNSIWRRIEEANSEGLYSETYYWLDYLCMNYETISSLARELQNEGILESATIGEMPDQIKTLKEAWGQSIQFSRNEIKKICGINSGNQLELKDTIAINDAFSGDKANIFARINVGFVTVAQHIAAAKEIMRNGPVTSEEQTDIVRGLRDRRKLESLQACMDIIGKDIPFPRQDSNMVGSVAVGLAVVSAHGELFPLSVKVVPNRAKVIKHQVENQVGVATYSGCYWSYYSDKYETVEQKDPISFRDYGGKDLLMRTSAMEVYKWLCNCFPTNMTDKGLEIDFQTLFSRKAGPSAGVTMAVSAYSDLLNIPVLKNVAMTGAITSDGSVHAIGGVYEKISGAANSDGIETVVVPKENESDLIYVPIDQLCRICIIESNDISTYLKIATDPNFYKYEITNLRKAQLLIRLGRFKEAEPLLLLVTAMNPDIYSAKRLLELLNCYGKLDGKDHAILKL